MGCGASKTTVAHVETTAKQAAPAVEQTVPAVDKTVTPKEETLEVQATYAMIKPGYEAQWGNVIERILAEGLEILEIKTFRMDQEFAEQFYAEHVGKSFFPTLSGYMTSGPVVGLKLLGPSAVSKWREIIGPTNLDKAKAEAPNSLRAQYARSTTENLCHGSDATTSAERELELVFGNPVYTRLATPTANDEDERSYAMIKPGYNGRLGVVINRILSEELHIHNIKSFRMTDNFAEQFYAEHVGKSFFPTLSGYMTSGQVYGIEVSGPSAVSKWREIIGPTNLDKAKAEAPNSLRAQYARSTTENLCHGSDATTSAERELELVFGKL